MKGDRKQPLVAGSKTTSTCTSIRTGRQTSLLSFLKPAAPRPTSAQAEANKYARRNDKIINDCDTNKKNVEPSSARNTSSTYRQTTTTTPKQTTLYPAGKNRRVTPDNNDSSGSNSKIKEDPQKRLEQSVVVPTTTQGDVISSPLRKNHGTQITRTEESWSADDDDENDDDDDDEEEQDHDDDDVETSPPSSSDNRDHNNPEGLSDYELLRLRNIERNNARLAALGLLAAGGDELSMNGPKKKKKTALNRRKRPSPSSCSADSSRQLPVRRSTRQRKGPTPDGSGALAEDSSLFFPPSAELNELSCTSSTNNAATTVVSEQDQEESYRVSPLVQYAMSAAGSCVPFLVTPPTPVDDEIVSDERIMVPTSLALQNTRLVPPSRLGAIYSLHFYGGISGGGGGGGGNNQWVVGAGKAGVVAVWDASATMATTSTTNNNNRNPDDYEAGDCESYSTIDSILSWKAHGGRWIAEARFLQSSPIGCSQYNNNNSNNENLPPSRLLTAANDGAVCLWDLTTVSGQDAVPKLLMRTGKELHASGIFSLDVQEQVGTTCNFATASKDKTIAISTLGADLGWWSSNHHSAKVGDVRFRGQGTSLLASVGDDGIVAIHDYRSSRIVAESSQAHNRPHSIVWNPTHEHVFMTAGHDKTIKLWDLRRFGDRSSPVGVLEGHVPLQETRCKKIHRPIFYQPSFAGKTCGNGSDSTFVLTGGQNSHSLSMFHSRGFFSELSHDPIFGDLQPPPLDISLTSRGKLPQDCGDAVCIAVNGSQVAVTTDQAEVLLLRPAKRETSSSDDTSAAAAATTATTVLI